MANIINGTDTGSGGLITTGDSSDELQIQTAETTALTITSGQQSVFIAGTAAAPAVTTTGDLNTGIFFPAGDAVGVATNGAEAARFNSSGNLVFPNGQGIDFSASAGGGASSSLLDDYEEGTYTATLTPSVSGSITLSDNTLSYTKIGRIVTVTGFIEVSGVSSPTGTYVALNLPFVINNSSTTRPSGSLAFNALGSSKAANIGWANGGIGSTNMEIYDGSVNSVGAGSFATYIVVNTTCRLTITYFTT